MGCSWLPFGLEGFTYTLREPARQLCKNPGGGTWAKPQLTQPTNYIRTTFLKEKLKFTKGGRHQRPILGIHLTGI